MPIINTRAVCERAPRRWVIWPCLVIVGVMGTVGAWHRIRMAHRLAEVPPGVFKIAAFNRTLVRNSNEGITEGEWLFECQVRRPCQFELSVRPQDRIPMLDLESGVTEIPPPGEIRRGKVLGTVTAQRPSPLSPYCVSLRIKYDRGILEVSSTGKQGAVLGKCDLNVQFSVDKWTLVAETRAGAEIADRGGCERLLVLRGIPRKGDKQLGQTLTVGLQICSTAPPGSDGAEEDR